VLLGCLEDGQCPSAEQAVVVIKQSEVHCNPLLHCRSGEPLSDAVAVGLIGNLLANRGQIVLAIGLLDLGQELGNK